MKKQTILFILGLGLSLHSFSQGLIRLSPEERATYPEMDAQVMGYAKDFPARHDMLAYAPPVQFQEGGTCVGFAAGYCAHSTMLNKSMGLTHPNHKYVVCMDPYFIYSFINSNYSDPCDEGLTFPDLFKVFENVGNMRDMYPPVLNCSFSWTGSNGEILNENFEYFQASLPFRISDWGFLNLEEGDWKETMRTFLANDVPVIVGADIDNNFDNETRGGKIQDNGVYYATPEENGEKGDHAMCVLGYDDYKAGGSFLVRNSWGGQWGDGGNVWIRYSDFREIVYAAAVIIPENWYENQTKSDDYNITFKETEVEGVEYGVISANGVIYEGFYAKDRRVLGYEIFEDGGVYFGQYTNLVKDGVGIFFDEDSERYKCEFKSGEVVDMVKGFASSAEERTFEESYLQSILDASGDWSEFEGELPSIDYIKE